MVKKRAYRISLIVVCLTFLLTTILGMNLFSSAFAADGAPGNLKFRQVEAGEDFAIGLTYGGDLYGWSLRDDAHLTNFNEAMNGTDGSTLGKYYPKTPTKIDVKFTEIDGTTELADSVSKIATTRTSAAFYTSKKYVYTWGFDAPKLQEKNGGEQKDVSSVLVKANGYNIADIYSFKPSIINYNYSSGNGNFKYINPKDTTVGNPTSIDDIVGGESNYILRFTKGSTQFNFVWGSANYSQSLSAAAPSGLYTGISSKMYVGGATVGYVDSNGLLNLQGRNTYMPYVEGGLKVADYITTANGNKLNLPNSTGITSPNTSSMFAKLGNTVYEIPNAVLNNFTALPSQAFDTVETEKKFFNSDGTDAGVRSLSRIALGNGFGFGIKDNSVYAWGNGYYNQSGGGSSSNLAVAKILTSLSITRPIQVIAGKMPLDLTLADYKYSYSADNALPIGTIVSDKINFQSPDKPVGGLLNAVLDESGAVYAFSDTINAKAVDFSKVGANTENNKIVSLSSGYGNNLFALSEQGKIYKISVSGNDFAVTMYSSFQYVGSKVEAIKNFELGSPNKINFKLSNDRTSQNKKSATFDLNSITTTEKLGAETEAFIRVNDRAGIEDDSSPKIPHFNKYIKSNSSADALRVMINKDQMQAMGANDYTKTFDDASIKLLNGATTPNGFDAKINFYFKENGTVSNTPLTQYQINSYFDFKVSADSSSKDINFTITPFQSTKSKSIIMKFWVGRYNTSANFDKSTIEGQRADCVFYEFVQPQMEITIDNTLAVEEKNSGMSAGTTGTCVVPLLDPNNFYNNTYSFALMDVSTGFSKLTEFMQSLNSKTNSQVVLNKIIENVTKNDNGFPSSTKTNLGSLDYYNKDAAKYYNDKYQYLASDRDGDKVTAAGFAGAFSSNTAKKTISIELDVSDQSIYGGLDFDKLINEFNNLYGFTFSFANNKLSISYDTVLLTATKSSESVTYTENKLDTFTTLDSYDKMPNFRVTMEEKNIVTPIYSPYIPVNSQASLSLSGKKISTDDKNTHKYFGKTTAGNNQYTNPSISMKLASNTDTITILLSDYFIDTPNNIKFAENGVSDDAAFAKFKSKYDSSIMDVTMDSNKIVVTAKTSSTLQIDAEIRRFDTGDKKFLQNGVDAEVIKIHFNLAVAPATFALKDGITQKYTVRSSTQIQLSERLLFDDINKIEIIKSFSSNSKILTTKVDPVTKVITLNAVISGIVDVTCVYKIKDIEGTLTDTFRVSVESMAIYDKVVSISDVQRFTFAELRNQIRSFNEENSEFTEFDKLVLDPTDDAVQESAIKYQIYDSTLNSWGEIIDDITKIPFLNSVLVSGENDDKYIRFESKEFSSAQDVPRVRVVIRFKENGNDTTNKFQIAIELAPSKKMLKDADGNSLVINIDKTKDMPIGTNFPTKNTDGSVRVDLKYLLSFMKDIKEPDKYQIVTVSTQDGSSKYFETFVQNNGSDMSISIYYPTESLTDKRSPIDVAVLNKDDGSYFTMTFYIAVEGISITLPVETYLMIVIAVASSVFGILLIIFIIRMGIFWKKKANQKRIIKKNQMLIKMRDKMHNKTEAVSKEQVVKTKLKMEDPKYAKLFTEMRKDKEEQTGISLDNSLVAHKAQTKMDAVDKANKGGKKKSGGKRSIEDMKAELEAKKAAFAQMQMGGVPMENMGMDQSIMDSAPVFDPQNDYTGGLSREDVENQIKAKLASDDNNVMFDIDVLPNDDKNGEN